MKTYVLDSHALLAYFERAKGWQKVAEALRLATEEKCRLLLSVINWGEVFYVTLREYDEEHAEHVLAAMRNMPIAIIEANKEMTLTAGRIKAEGGLSYADCFAAGLAKSIEGIVITGDPEFKKVENEVEVLWL